MTDHDCDACPNNKGLELATAEVERLTAERDVLLGQLVSLTETLGKATDDLRTMSAAHDQAEDEVGQLRVALRDIEAAASRGTASRNNECAYCPSVKLIARMALAVGAGQGHHQ